MTDRPTNPTDRPGLRPAAPAPASVNGHRPTDTDRPAPDVDTDRKPGRLTRLLAGLTRRPTDQPEPTNTDRPTTPVTKPTDHSRRHADQTKPTNTDRPATPTPAPTAQPTDQTDQPRRRFTIGRTTRPTDPIAIAVAAAAHRRPTTPTTTSRPTDVDIAPVPHKLKWLGVWLDRTFGAMPLLAPLLVSGYYTTKVFTGDPIDAHPAVAILAACALEGGVWKLSRLYEKTLVAGDSTMALRLGIGAYLGLISGLIYWHADHTAQLKGQETLGADALPAVGVAVMSALGVFIWSRTARWARRRELHAQGRVDTQAPKFAALAWILCPIETPKALRHAVKYRIPSPVEAVADLRLYKSVGKPAVWPPLTDHDPADRPTGQAHRPTDVPTRPEPTDQQHRPTTKTNRPQSDTTATDRPAAPTTDRPTVATRPTDPAARPQPTAPRPTADASPAPTATVKPTDQTDFTAAAIRNAAYLRSRYGTTADLRLPTVRGDLGWSYDKANPALKAYLAGADRPLAPTN